MDVLCTGNTHCEDDNTSAYVYTRSTQQVIRACVRIVDYSRVASCEREESGLRMQSLSTPRRVYPAKRARLLDAKAKERCDKAVPRPGNMAALTHEYQL